MNYLQKLFKLPNSIRNKVKELENVKSKYVKCKWSFVFNDTCLKDKIDA